MPVVLREQNDIHSDCYFCMTKLSVFSRKHKFKIVYPDCQSALKPISHELRMPEPISPAKRDIENQESYKSSVSSAVSSTDEIYVADVDNKNHICLVSWSWMILYETYPFPKKK